jgi:hypothetical protein
MNNNDCEQKLCYRGAYAKWPNRRKPKPCAGSCLLSNSGSSADPLERSMWETCAYGKVQQTKSRGE